MLVKEKFIQIEGHIASPQGYRAAGVQAGIKQNKKDMALIVSDMPCSAAGVYTTNRVSAAPVQHCRKLTPGNGLRAIIVNSGNANACTGAQGLRDAETMARQTAERLQCEPHSVLVCSTGTIGRLLPMNLITKGIDLAAESLAATGGPDAAAAIMTTDTRPKQVAFQMKVNEKTVTLGGMAKGAGMINPAMATLLAFLTTDAAVEPGALQACLAAAVAKSFNRISVDGDQSTNDTVLILANGRAGNTPLTPQHPDWKIFRAAVNEATLQLARMIVKDGEGATKFVTITVKGAPGRRAAARVARAIANSLLVKTSWFGADPNWGRVICAVGYAGAPVRPELVDIAYDGMPAVKQGQSAGLAPDILRGIILKPEFTIDIDLHIGQSSYTIYTCDCSDQYVSINASYMT
ncbi:MAG: bifunctional glutamate N-acetyltransferase/amino-acid acetyltransferase ArgJ [Verrucomicrobia bacterium]|nr:bifunctional glutamate N-acetyltransferase/amino-acid acetyltransferase ArgJ [Verrucomicrobiota bacterium]MBU4290677.1 bifunctional glutamate N-acetyltransferase/amino-acid acetyltransferase ArgJ [Verrucomicrobiota bacterium]